MGAQRGAHTGRNPTDRGKKGAKRHIVTDARGTPLLVRTGPANQRDDRRARELVRDLPVIPDAQGQPQRVQRLLADAGYGFSWVILAVWLYGIEPLIRRRGKGVPHGSGLGTRRYVVERALAWFGNFRRLRQCYERSWHHWQALNELAACVICANKLHRLRQPPKADKASRRRRQF